MNTKHTTGPWMLTMANTITAWNDNKEIATVWSNPSRLHVPAEEAKANAKLIAAAPELLEALIATTDAFDCLIQDQMADLPGGDLIKWAEIEEARAAIAKATE